MNALKILAIIMLVLVVLNLILFAMGIISPLTFWVIIIAIALIAFYIIPNMKKKLALEE